MRKITLALPQVREEIRFLGSALFGCALIAFGSLIRIDCYPVPFTLHTMAIFLIGLWQQPKTAAASVGLYLLCATLSLPVLGGKINPLWIAETTGGYLIAFPFAAFLLSTIRKRAPAVLAIFVAQALIWTVGWIWLAMFIGAKTAFIQGVWIFIPSAFYKAAASLALAYGWRLWSR